MNHLLKSSVLNMESFTKLPLLIHFKSNGVVEHKNRTLKEMMNVILISSGLPQNLWEEALLFANYILNKVLHKKTRKTPYELWKFKDHVANT